MAAGTKRSESFGFSRKADVVETIGKSVQFVPSVEYCQTPCVGIDAFAVIAMPAKALAVVPPETVSSRSLNAPVKRLATVALGLPVTSSVAAGRTAVPAPLRTGASLTGVMVMATVFVSVSGPPAPVLPRSSTVMVSDWVVDTVFVFNVGVKLSVASAALMAALVPWNTIVPSAVPSPVLKTSPVIVPSVSVPLAPGPRSSVTRSTAPKSSGSASDRPGTRLLAESLLTVTAVGAVSTGPSLVFETLTKNVPAVVLLPVPLGLVSAPLLLSSTSVLICTRASALPAVGANTIEFSVACTSAKVPLTTMVALPLLSVVASPLSTTVSVPAGPPPGNVAPTVTST